MDKLIVLSERDCSKDLQRAGIIPKALYTSVDKCERALMYEQNIKLVIIFNGLSKFNMPRVVNFYKKLLEISDREKDKASVHHTRLLSDVQVIGVHHFYMYDRDYSNIWRAYNTKLLGFKRDKQTSKFWETLEFENAEKCEVYDDKDGELRSALDRLLAVEKNPEYDRLTVVDLQVD